MDIFNLLKSTLNFLQRQWKFIMTFFVIGVLLALIFDFLRAPYYETSATATSGLSYFEGIIDPSELEYPIIDQKIAIDMVNGLGKIVVNGEHQILANKLKVSEEIAQTVELIEAEQSYELDLENRRQKLSQFSITIKVNNNQSIKSVSDGILTYFNNNGYANKNYSLFQKQSPELITYLNQEITDLQSYRSHLNDKTDFEMSTISIANDNSESLQNQIIQLYEKKQSLERDLELLKPLSFVSNFPVYRNPTSRTMFRVGVLSFSFLFLGFFIALFRDVKSFMK
jgi:hypothetical protein